MGSMLNRVLHTLKLTTKLILGPQAYIDANGTRLTVEELAQLNEFLALSTGNVYYADSVNGSSGYDGKSKTKGFGKAGPKATIEQAEALCSAGDMVVVLPGHTEAITTNDQIDVGAGITVLGIGYGHRRPTLTWSGTDATACVALEGQGARWLNILHVSSDAGDDITGMVRVEGDDQEVAFCEFREGTGQPESAILISDGADRFNIHDNRITSLTNGAAANDAGIEFSSASTGTTGGRIVNNHIHGTYDQACIWCSNATAASTDLVIEGNTLINTATGLYAIDMGAGTNMTGMIKGNVVETDAEPTSIRGGGLTLISNRYGLDTKENAFPGMPFGNHVLSMTPNIIHTSTTADEIAVVSAGGPVIIDHILLVGATLAEAEAAAVFDNIVTGSSGNLYAADQETALQDSAFEVGDMAILGPGGVTVVESANTNLEDIRPLGWLVQAGDTIDIEGGSAEAEGTAHVVIAYRSLGGELEMEGA